MEIIQILIIIIITLAILTNPYLGIVFTAATLPIANVLPSVMLVSSIAPIIGAITLAAFFFNRKDNVDQPLFRFADVHVLGIKDIGGIFKGTDFVSILPLDM